VAFFSLPFIRMARRRTRDDQLDECEETLGNVYEELEIVRHERQRLSDQQEQLQATIAQYEEEIQLCREMQEISQRELEVCQEIQGRLARLATAAGYKGPLNLDSILTYLENTFNNARARQGTAKGTSERGGPSTKACPSRQGGPSRQASPPGLPPCPFSTPEEFRRAECEQDAEFAEFLNPATSLERKKRLYRNLAFRYHPDRRPEYRACSQDIRGACFSQMDRPR